MQYFCSLLYYNLDCTVFVSKNKCISLPVLGCQNSWDAKKVQILKEGNACVTFSRFKDAILTQFNLTNLMDFTQNVPKMNILSSFCHHLTFNFCTKEKVFFFFFQTKLLFVHTVNRGRGQGPSKCKKDKKKKLHIKSSEYI